PNGESASARTWGGPPAASILLSFPSAKNPIELPPGDQKRPVTPSVPASGAALEEDSGRSQIELFPPAACATKPTRRPSGETARWSKESKEAFSGIVRERRTGLGETSRRRPRSAAADARAARIATAATPHAIRSRRRDDPAATGAGASACDPCAIHLSSLAMSCALCQRSSGSLARQPRTTRSSAGGVIGWIVERDGGSPVRIAAIRDAWLFPSNAFPPGALS